MVEDGGDGPIALNNLFICWVLKVDRFATPPRWPSWSVFAIGFVPTLLPKVPAGMAMSGLGPACSDWACDDDEKVLLVAAGSCCPCWEQEGDCDRPAEGGRLGERETPTNIGSEAALRLFTPLESPLADRARPPDAVTLLDPEG